MNRDHTVILSKRSDRRDFLKGSAAGLTGWSVASAWAEPADVPLMIEHMKGPAGYNRSRQYLFDLGKRIQVRFE